jgi:hypothetical protein
MNLTVRITDEDTSSPPFAKLAGQIKTLQILKVYKYINKGIYSLPKPDERVHIVYNLIFANISIDVNSFIR